MKEIYIDWTKLSRNFNEIPLILDRSKNKREDLIFNDLKYLVDNYSFCEITKILNVRDNYLIRQLKLYNLKTNVDRRKKFNKLSQNELELLKYGKIGLSKKEKQAITIEKIGKKQFLAKRNQKFRETWQKRTIEAEKDRIIKAKAKKLAKYGNYNNYEKIKQTNLKKYGVISKIINKDILEKTNSKDIIDKMNQSRVIAWRNKSSEEKKKIYEKVVKNSYITKKVNNSFNISQPEKEIEILLKKKFTRVITQYKSEKYPFNCDFYIPERELYIEFQGTWTHGKHPFSESQEDLEILTKWKLKNTEYYNNAIEVWTKRDVLKRQTAIQNNLNWLEFFTFEDFSQWYNSL